MDRSDQNPPQTIRLEDYRPPAFSIPETDLCFELDGKKTRVTSRLRIERVEPGSAEPLILDGEDLKSVSIAIDGRMLKESEYRIDQRSLVIADVPDQFELVTDVEIAPASNTGLMGLYESSGNLCTQCEAEGFRRITWFLDRPDVLSRFKTTLIADGDRYPVLLSNGNPVEQRIAEDGRNVVVWDDPWPKPSYLFALVGGKLEFVETEFLTSTGRAVNLRIYAEAHNVDKCDFALASLEKAMRWDEEVYGREYDLEIYNVVAVDDFNMGAMENKGLNVFNSKYVLASPLTATDVDYQNIEGVIGHEYFHNWSGNRVTCRDWFQLSLKEGFTVFRDQQFSADTASEGVKRIQDVNVLRTHQFREDAGPMAHPVQPPLYVEINNFYTVTIYNKGAELVRMLYHLAGARGFRKGTDLYFDRHDGQAVTIDEFVKAVSDANDLDLEQFKRWYHQAGTPRVHATRDVDESGQWALTLEQHCPDTPSQSDKKPFHIPLAFAMIGPGGDRQRLDFLDHESVSLAEDGCSAVLHLTEARQQFRLKDMNTTAVPSLLRGFSAPIVLTSDLVDQEHVHLMACDDDAFCRWESGQYLATRVILDAAEGREYRDRLTRYIEAFSATLKADIADLSFKAEALKLPTESLLAESMTVIDPDRLHDAHKLVRRRLSDELHNAFKSLYQELNIQEDYRPDQASAGRRALKNVCLDYLVAKEDDVASAISLDQFHSANNMTDQFAAFRSIATGESENRERVIDEFYKKWQSEALVIDKWFSVQAMRPHPDVADDISRLAQHPAFEIKNPNRARSLYGAFASANLTGFHRADGSGYALLGECVRHLDTINPQVAARLVSTFLQWRRYDEKRKSLMCAQLEKTLESPNISKDVFEIVSKSLADS